MRKILFIYLLFIALFCEGHSFAANRKTTYSKGHVSNDIRAFEEYCHGEINKVRQQHGLRLLKEWPQLSDCARGHSQNMAIGKCPLGHDGFDKRAKQMGTLAKLSSFGENVAYSYNYKDPVKIAVDGWMKSKGHRENILADFDESGIGVAISKDGKFYITQLFAKRYIK